MIKLLRKYLKKLILISVVLSLLLYVKSQWSSGEFYHSGDSPARVLVVGAGITGAVLARMHAEIFKTSVVVIDSRSYVGGSCHDYLMENNIRVSQFGLRFFYTNVDSVVRFLSRFTDWFPYEHRVIANWWEKLVPIPANIQAVDVFYQLVPPSMEQFQRWLSVRAEEAESPVGWVELCKEQNVEEIYWRLVDPVYSKLWKADAGDLDPDVVECPPLRQNFEDRLYPGYRYQALPAAGYTEMVERMLSHSRIEVKLEVEFRPYKEQQEAKGYSFDKVFYTGRIDEYFRYSGHPKLKYLFINFEIFTFSNVPYFQSAPVIEYPLHFEEYLRIVEYKHFIGEKIEGTTIGKEYSSLTGGEPYLPFTDQENLALYSLYSELAREEERLGVHFAGHLTQFQYTSIGESVENAMSLFKRVYPAVSFDWERLYGGSKSQQAISIFSRDPNKPSLSLIVSHCSESLSWLRSGLTDLCLQNDVTIFVYEKCWDWVEAALLWPYRSCKVTNIRLHDKGGVSHTFVYHMLYKTAYLKDINFFFPGQPIYNTVSTIKKIVTRMKSNIHSFSPFDFVTTDKGQLNRHFDTEAPYHCPFHFYETLAFEGSYCFWYAKITNTKDRCLEAFGSVNHEFAVTKTLLLRAMSHHRGWLTSLFDILERLYDATENQFIERLWTTFFRYPSVEFRTLVPECKVPQAKD